MKKDSKKNLPFRKRNYLIMLAGIFTLIIGFIVMSLDEKEYGFGLLGITIGPLIVLTGFIIEFFAILYNPKKEE